MKMTTRMIRVMLLTILVSTVCILAMKHTEAASPINLNFEQNSSGQMKVPEDQPTIQAAINAANPGDTIFVYNGTYQEHVIVNKTVTLTGQNRTITIIDGNGTGTPLTITAPNVTVTEFTIRSGPTQPPSFPLSGININSTGNTIQNNTITENDFCAVGVTYHGNNTIKKNTITNNTIGIFLLYSNSNIIIQNNLINNINAETYSSHNNTWDSGYLHGGNHWSDYTGKDEKSGQNQDEPGSDTIGDIPYGIDPDNQDNYPLINHWTPEPTKTFTIKHETETYIVNTESNCTVTHFQFNHTQKQITFNVTGTPDTTGYCNITIPKNLPRNNPWTIKIDNETIYFTENGNENHTFLHFTFELQSTHHITIKGTWVVPEFPPHIIPLLTIITLTAIVLTKKRKPKKT